MVEKKPAMVETGASSTDRLRPGLMSAWGQTRTFGDGTQCPLCLAPRKQTWLNALRVAAQDRGNRGEKQRRPSAIACATAVEESAAACNRNCRCVLGVRIPVIQLQRGAEIRFASIDTNV